LPAVPCVAAPSPSCTSIVQRAAAQIDYRRTEITAKLKLTYFKNQFLELQIQHEKWDEWQTCFTVFNVTLPGSPFLGYSAHTGDVSGASFPSVALRDRPLTGSAFPA
jgi:hypothetical protein